MKKTIVSLAAGFLLVGTAATSVSAQEYKVQEGDTLSGLSQEFDVSVDDLIVVNQHLDIHDENNSDNVVNEDVAPTTEQAQQASPAEPLDDPATNEEGDQEANQPEADEKGVTEPVNEEPVEEQEPQVASNDQDAKQNEGHSEENDEETTNGEDNDEDADTSEGESMTMSSTAYTAECEGCSGTTADGTELTGDENVVAVDPDKIPIGSEVHVEGYGDAVAADAGGDINDDRIDLHMGDEGEAMDWGRQDVEVTVK